MEKSKEKLRKDFLKEGECAFKRYDPDYALPKNNRYIYASIGIIIIIIGTIFYFQNHINLYFQNHGK